MRTSQIIFAAVLLTACSDDTEPTAPHSTTTAALSEVQSTGQAASPARRGAPVVTTVVGPLAAIDPFISQFAEAFAVCPTGSIVVGGGFQIQSGSAVLKVTNSEPAGNTHWRIRGWSSVNAEFRTVARCLQE